MANFGRVCFLVFVLMIKNVDVAIIPEAIEIQNADVAIIPEVPEITNANVAVIPEVIEPAAVPVALIAKEVSTMSPSLPPTLPAWAAQPELLRQVFEVTTKRPEVTTGGTETTTKSRYVWSFGGAVSALSAILPENLRPDPEEVTKNAEDAFLRIQDLGMVLFCNPFFAGINPGSCVLLHNATIQGLQG